MGEWTINQGSLSRLPVCSRVRAALATWGLLSSLLILALAVPAGSEAQSLYGIVSKPPYAGYVIEINTRTGDVTRLFPTGVPEPAGLTYDPETDALLTIAAETGQVYRIDLAHQTASPLLPTYKPETKKSRIARAQGLAYSSRDGCLYTLREKNGGGYELTELDPSSGVSAEGTCLATPDEGSSSVPTNWNEADRVAVRPSDGELNPGRRLSEAMLYRTADPCAPDRAASHVGRMMSCGGDLRVTGMDFHPTTGELYVSYAGALLVLDGPMGEAKSVRTTGDTAEAVSFLCGCPVTAHPYTGGPTLVRPLASDIGDLGGIAFASAPAPDVWIKDCEHDDGTTPSAPGRCRQANASPDIWIETDVDRRLDRPRYGEDNWLYARVRNRNRHGAQGATLAFYYWECGVHESAEMLQDPMKCMDIAPRLKLVDRTRVDVPAEGTALARVLWRQLPKPSSWTKKWCIQAVVDHDYDRVHVPTGGPRLDNNVAVTDTEILTERDNRGRPHARTVLTQEEKRTVEYPGERESAQLGTYPISYSQRPLVMERGMVRITSILGFKRAGTYVSDDDKGLLAFDAGFAFGVHRNIEVGLSNYRLGSSPPKTGQSLVSLTFLEQNRLHWGDIPLYSRFRFVDRDIWQVAADLVLVFPAYTKLASTLGIPIRVRPRDYDLAIDWGIEGTLLTEEFGGNIDLPVKLTYNVTHRGFIFGSFGLSIQQIGRRENPERPEDTNVAFQDGTTNQVLIPLALGGGYTGRLRNNRRWMVDIFGQGGFNPLVYFNPPSATESGSNKIDQVPLSESWFLSAGANFYFDPVVR